MKNATPDDAATSLESCFAELRPQAICLDKSVQTLSDPATLHTQVFSGCQDYLGCSMRPLGGVLGGMSALGGAVEHQNHGTPHFHAEGHVVCAYQYKTLAEIAGLLQKRLVSVVFNIVFNDLA